MTDFMAILGAAWEPWFSLLVSRNFALIRHLDISESLSVSKARFL